MLRPVVRCHVPGAKAPSTGAFTCHACGACCTGLRERGTDRGFAELAPGIYRHAGEGGLRVFCWEAHAFPADQLAPLLVVADRAQDQRLALAYQLQADTCPNLDEDSSRCTVYADRPLVCRAFPLVVERGEDGPELAASEVCGARVPLPTGPDHRKLAEAYPDAFAPALAVPRLWRWLVDIVAFLDQTGIVDPAPELDPDELAALGPTVPLGERLASEGVMAADELAEKAREHVARIRARARDEQG